MASVVVLPEPATPVTITSPSRNVCQPFGQSGRKPGPYEIGNRGGDDPQAGAQVAAAVEQIHAKAGGLSGVGEIERKINVLLRLQARKRFAGAQRKKQFSCFVAFQGHGIQGGELAVHPHHGRITGDQVQVGGAGDNGFVQPRAQSWGIRSSSRAKHWS